MGAIFNTIFNTIFNKEFLACGVTFIDSQVKSRLARVSLLIKELDQCRGKNISAVAVANKNARIAWAVLTKKEPYKAAA